MEKGKLNGKCNRTACQQPGAVYYNHSTRAYYCAECADLINKVNPESKRIYSHDLCTLEKIPINTRLQYEEIIYMMSEDGLTKEQIDKKIGEVKIYRGQRN